MTILLFAQRDLFGQFLPFWAIPEGH